MGRKDLTEKVNWSLKEAEWEKTSWNNSTKCDKS